MSQLKDKGEKHLNSDIRLITTDISLVHRLPRGQEPLSDYHATVGGCAILSFGSLAHITFPSDFLDPSGAGTFIGAKIQPHSALPPVFLNAVYIFPPSQGPTTLNSRIAQYLRTCNSNVPPCKWQRSIIEQLLKSQYDNHPNCSQIVGGDFNHRDWANINHPITQTFINSLHLTNYAYEAVATSQGHIPSPITYLTHNTWIDHFLHIGRIDVTDFCDYRNSPVTTYTDHAPYSNDIYIQLPTQHYNIPKNTNIHAHAQLRAVHIKKTDSIAYQRYQAICNKYLPSLTPDATNWSPQEHENHYDHICNALVAIAKKATKYSIRTSMPAYTKWSPELSFLYKFIRFLTSTKLKFLSIYTQPISEQNPPAQDVLHRISPFLTQHYSTTKVINDTTVYRYRSIILKIFPSYPRLPIPDDNSLNGMTAYINEIIKSCRRLCHAKHQTEMRTNINKAVANYENLHKEGRLKRVINWILEKSSTPRFTTVVTTSNQIKAIPKQAHHAILQHFTQHFSCHPWISESCINDHTTEGQLLRNSLLCGTWRNEYPTLTHSLEPRHRQYAAIYFDNFKYKASHQQRASLQELTNNPIPFDLFYKALLNRSGVKSPGPSGLTISILQATPTPILQSLHDSLVNMWTHRHVPQSWQYREMALIPKKPNSVTLAELRPLMLLEVIRKLWLSLILKPIATYISQQHLICPYQVGGVPNSGTEDAILQLINALEDSTERAENIEILAFDKAKAFDSPGRLSGISLGWQRMGIPADVANYIAECDNDNHIFPRTPHYLCSRQRPNSLSFHARMGTPQGCSSASLSYLVVEDIILSTFQTTLSKIDPYLARDPSGLLFQQPPTQFVDDTYVFCRSTTGAQNAINLLQTAEPLLNIRINPTKTRHFSLHWNPPTSNHKPFYTLDEPTPTLYAHNTDGTRVQIVPIPTSQATRVLGAWIAPDLSSDYLKTIKSQIHRIKQVMLRKKASADIIWSVLKASVYPKFTYILKFTNHSMHDLNKLSGTLRDLIRQKTNASHLPNAILFSGNATPYSLPYHDLMSHIVREKESTMLRMLSSSAHSRQVMHALLCRGQRLITENYSFTNNPTPCPRLPHHLEPSQSTHYCWAHSLIQYLQAANSNIHTASLFPTSAPTYTVTQTPIHTSYDQALDSPLTLEDILDFESSYHLYFIEELFPYPLKHPTTYLSSLSNIFPSQYEKFLRRIILENYDNHKLSLGQVISREHMLLHLPSHTYPTYMEGILHHLNTNQNMMALTRTWIPSHARQHTPSFLRIPHDQHQTPKLTPLPLHPYQTRRYLHSALGYTKTFTTCKVLPLNQLILPRNHPPFTAIYAPPAFTCTFPSDVTSAWRTLTSRNTYTPTIYTDGSLRPQVQLTTMQPTEHNPEIYTSIVFSSTPTNDTPWTQRDVIAVRIAFPKPTTANNYTAEILGVAAASSLPTTDPITVYTDAHGIITSTNKTVNQYISPPIHTTPHLPRNYTETGLLYQHIVQQHHRLQIHHIKAHQEDAPRAKQTEHGTGNRLADLIAQGQLDQALQLAPKLRMYTTSTHDLINPPIIQPLIRIGPAPSPHDYTLHHPNHTLKMFHTNCINHWLNNIRPHTSRLSTVEWSDLSWNLAGMAINQYTKSTRTKMFLMKTLYDALPNDYTKYKYASNTNKDQYPSSSQDPNHPACPLCATSNDSLSHLFCQCPHPHTKMLRDTLTRKLLTLGTSMHYSNPLLSPVQQLTNLILLNFTSTYPDHRNLLGLYHTPTQIAPHHPLSSLKAALKIILPETVPFIQEVWKFYCMSTHSHPDTQTTVSNTLTDTVTTAPQLRRPRLIILSGNNATMTLQTIQGLPPSNYTRRPRHKHTEPHNLHQQSQRTILELFPKLHSSILPLTHQHSPLTPSTPFQLTQHLTLSTSTLPTNQTQQTSLTRADHNFIFPRRTFRPSLPTPQSAISTSTQIAPYSHLSVSEPSPQDDLAFPLPFPHQSASSLAHLRTNDMRQILDKLNLFAHDVPQNGDCFYLAIQLHYIKAQTKPHLVSIPILRKSIHNLLTKSKIGNEIRRDYQVDVHTITANVLPNLRPDLFPHRDTYAADYVVAAMATLLQTPIDVISVAPAHPPIKYSFRPYPQKDSLPFINPAPLKITLWQSQAHYQLLLPQQSILPSINTGQLLLPRCPTHNINTQGQPITIPSSLQQTYYPRCPFATSTLPTTSYAFCPSTCHLHCSNHYSAFRPIPLLRTAPTLARSQLITLEGIYPHTILAEISATIFTSPLPHTTQVTSSYHSDALQTHPLIILMHSHHEPNCALTPILIPEPAPHVKLFLTSTRIIPPYNSLRIRPPPEPPPRSTILSSTEAAHPRAPLP